MQVNVFGAVGPKVSAWTQRAEWPCARQFYGSISDIIEQETNIFCGTVIIEEWNYYVTLVGNQHRNNGLFGLILHKALYASLLSKED